jgi:hypothetical protein
MKSNATARNGHGNWGAHAPSRAGDDALVIANFLTGNFAWGRDDLRARTLVDGVEAVVVLVAFRCFAQFPANERQRARSGEEKGCGLRS